MQSLTLGLTYDSRMMRVAERNFARLPLSPTNISETLSVLIEERRDKVGTWESQKRKNKKKSLGIITGP